MAAPQLKLYGLDGSQPCRTVSWLLRINKVPFEYINMMPGKQTRTKEFLSSKNRWGNVPVLEHGDNVVLSESAAIIAYLADTFHWNDLYPKDDAAARARIDQWLHWHHRGSREFTLVLFAPIMRPDLKISAERIAEGERSLKSIAKGLDDALASTPFLVGNKPTLADFSVFADLGQCHSSELNLYDFSPFPNLDKWILRMRQLPFYEESHSILPMFKQHVDKVKQKKAKAAKL